MKQTETPAKINGFNYGFHSSLRPEQEKKIPDCLISGFSSAVRLFGDDKSIINLTVQVNHSLAHFVLTTMGLSQHYSL